MKIITFTLNEILFQIILRIWCIEIIVKLNMCLLLLLRILIEFQFHT